MGGPGGPAGGGQIRPAKSTCSYVHKASPPAPSRPDLAGRRPETEAGRTSPTLDVITVRPTIWPSKGRDTRPSPRIARPPSDAGVALAAKGARAALRVVPPFRHDPASPGSGGAPGPPGTAPAGPVTSSRAT